MQMKTAGVKDDGYGMTVVVQESDDWKRSPENWGPIVVVRGASFTLRRHWHLTAHVGLHWPNETFVTHVAARTLLSRVVTIFICCVMSLLLIRFRHNTDRHRVLLDQTYMVMGPFFVSRPTQPTNPSNATPPLFSIKQIAQWTLYTR